MKFVDSKSGLTPPTLVVCATNLSKAVVPVFCVDL